MTSIQSIHRFATGPVLRRLLAAVLPAALIGGGLPVSAHACDMTGAYIINLSQDNADKSELDICTARDGERNQEACIRNELMNELPAACRGAIDIFVPGTNAEFGAWKQFNHMFKTDNDRAHVSLRYQDAREADNDLIDFDPGKYDEGVIDANDSLTLLLRTILRAAGMGPGTRLRVFGHSKGAHAVALVAENPDFAGVEFYAFAQPGRTERDISAREAIRPARRGKPGYIEKLTDNLVGITWRNDEVRYMFGKDLTTGGQVPETWGFPGFINDTGSDGTSPVLAEAFRIDHHNNYGGLYTDGVSNNEWRDGEGSRDIGWPYCATGDKDAWDSAECDESRVTFLPWFWGHPHCQAEAFRMMKSGAVGDDYYIGYSGPRDRRSCRESQRRIAADWEIRLRYNVPDKDCIHRVSVLFKDLGNRTVGSFTVNGTTDNDSTWLVRSGSASVPLHMKLELDVDLLEDNDGGNCNAFAANQSEVWINYLRLWFARPGIGGRIQRTIIGYEEGKGSFGTLDNFGNVGWNQPGKSNEEFRMSYDGLPFKSIKIQADAESPKSGNFWKRVHLVD